MPTYERSKFCFGKLESRVSGRLEPQTPWETYALDRLLRRTDGLSDAPDHTGDREAPQEGDSGRDKIRA